MRIVEMDKQIQYVHKRESTSTDEDGRDYEVAQHWTVKGKQNGIVKSSDRILGIMGVGHRMTVKGLLHQTNFSLRRSGRDNL